MLCFLFRLHLPKNSEMDQLNRPPRQLRQTKIVSLVSDALAWNNFPCRVLHKALYVFRVHVELWHIPVILHLQSCYQVCTVVGIYPAVRFGLLDIAISCHVVVEVSLHGCEDSVRP